MSERVILDGEPPLTADEISGKVGARPVGPPLPVCPHCEADPCVVAASLIQMGMKSISPGAMAVVFFCAACRKVLSVAPLAGVTTAPTMPGRILRPV